MTACPCGTSSMTSAASLPSARPSYWCRRCPACTYHGHSTSTGRRGTPSRAPPRAHHSCRGGARLAAQPRGQRKALRSLHAPHPRRRLDCREPRPARRRMARTKWCASRLKCSAAWGATAPATRSPVPRDNATPSSRGWPSSLARPMTEHALCDAQLGLRYDCVSVIASACLAAAGTDFAAAAAALMLLRRFRRRRRRRRRRHCCCRRYYRCRCRRCRRLCMCHSELASRPPLCSSTSVKPTKTPIGVHPASQRRSRGAYPFTKGASSTTTSTATREEEPFPRGERERGGSVEAAAAAPAGCALPPRGGARALVGFGSKVRRQSGLSVLLSSRFERRCCCCCC